jgi:hypothetical protein
MGYVPVCRVVDKRHLEKTLTPQASMLPTLSLAYKRVGVLPLCRVEGMYD